MTINMVGQMFSGFQIDHDMEAFLETYEEMMELTSDTGYEAVDVTSLETVILGIDTVNLLKFTNDFNSTDPGHMFVRFNGDPIGW